MDDAKTEIQRLNKVISVIEIDLASSEQLVKEKADKIDTMTKEMTSLQSQIFDFNLKLKKYVDENNSKQKLIDHYEKERKDILTKYSTYQNEIEKSQQDKLNQYAKTISIYEKSLEDEKAKNDYLKEKYNQMYNEMQNNMKMISSEWDKKLKKVQNNYESIITDIETKQKYDIDTMKTKYEIESQKNIEEIAKLKTIVDNYKNIDHDYIKISNHENILNEKIKKILNEENEQNEQKEQKKYIESSQSGTFCNNVIKKIEMIYYVTKTNTQYSLSPSKVNIYYLSSLEMEGNLYVDVTFDVSFRNEIEYVQRSGNPGYLPSHDILTGKNTTITITKDNQQKSKQISIVD